MKNILFITFVILLFSNFVFSQNKLHELEKIKKIKIFKSNQQDVKKILADYVNEDYDLEDSFQTIQTKRSYILITFSEGNCGEDEYWNISKGLVTAVSISNLDEVKVKDIGFDLKTFKKEIEDKDYPNDIDYHNEKKGILIKTEDGEVKDIIFYPPKSKIGFLCTNENTTGIISGEERLVDEVVPFITVCRNSPPVLNKVILSDTEVFASTGNEKSKINVRVSATDSEGDPLVYDYKVSGGKIIGQGARVIWDLSGVKSGNYTITASVDDGCGVCSEPKTKTVIVK